MAMLTVSLRDDTVKFLEDQARHGGHASVDSYLDAVLYEIRLREARRKFEAKVQEGIDGGPGIPVTPEFWEELRREGIARFEAERRGS